MDVTSDRELSPVGSVPAEALARQIVDDGVQRYFQERRERVRPFVDRNFSLRGSLRLHRAAVGWDIARAPLNLTMAGPQVGLLLAAKGRRENRGVTPGLEPRRQASARAYGGRQGTRLAAACRFAGAAISIRRQAGGKGRSGGNHSSRSACRGRPHPRLGSDRRTRRRPGTAPASRSGHDRIYPHQGRRDRNQHRLAQPQRRSPRTSEAHPGGAVAWPRPLPAQLPSGPPSCRSQWAAHWARCGTRCSRWHPPPCWWRG